MNIFLRGFKGFDEDLAGWNFFPRTRAAPAPLDHANSSNIMKYDRKYGSLGDV